MEVLIVPLSALTWTTFIPAAAVACDVVSRDFSASTCSTHHISFKVIVIKNSTVACIGDIPAAAITPCICATIVSVDLFLQELYNLSLRPEVGCWSLK